MANYGKGIPLSTGFDLGAESPLDSRITVDNLEELNDMVLGHRAYEGMKVYVTSVKQEYRYIGTEWELVPDKSYVDDAVANVKIDEEQLSNYATKDEIPTKTSQLTNDSGFIVAIPSEYITESELNTELSTKADKSDIPSLNGYATETYVTNKIAEASLSGGEVDLSGYATKDELNAKANKSDIPNLDGYALKTDIPTVPTKISDLTNDRGYITEVPSEYITESELESKGYLTEHQDISDKANKADIPTKTSQLENDNGYLTSVPSEYVTETELNAKGYLTEHQSLDNYALKTEIPTKTSQLTNNSGFITEHQDISGKADKSYVDTELAKKSDKTHAHSYNDLSDKPTIPSVDGLATKKELIDGLSTKSDIGHTHDQYLTEHQDISGKADKSEIPTKTSQLTNDSNYLTSVPSEYVTETELNSKGYLTQHQDLSDYALKTEIPNAPTKTSQLTNDSGFITSIPNEYITETELDAKGYLTEHQDISGKMDKVEGKGLSTNDLTNNLKTQYDTAYSHSQSAHAPIDAEANVQSDWNVTDVSSDAYILNKPTIPNKTSQLTNDSGYLTEHQDLSNYQTKSDNTLTTTDKTIVGAINELDVESIKAEDYEDSSVIIENNLTSRVSTLETECIKAEDYEDSSTIQISSIAKNGTTSARPTNNLYIGLMYFDTTLNKPIWYNGTTWVDANGTTV